jgi:hypothetical protein
VDTVDGLRGRDNLVGGNGGRYPQRRRG